MRFVITHIRQIYNYIGMTVIKCTLEFNNHFLIFVQLRTIHSNVTQLFLILHLLFFLLMCFVKVYS